MSQLGKVHGDQEDQDGNPEYKDWKELDVETWRGLEELYKAGKVKAIGVSNFLLHHLENLIQNCEIMPMADQSFGNFLNLFESKQLQTKMPVFNTSR